MRGSQSRAGSVLIALFLLLPVIARATAFDFESGGDGDPVTDLFPGVALTNATAIVAGASLNQLEFPPRSGNTVVFDDGGPMTIDFVKPVASVGAWLTYSSALTFTAYDSALNVIGTELSLFGSNLALSGEPGSSPNEFIGVASLTEDIYRVTISGDAGGGSFALDDLTVEFRRNGQVPEPPAIAPMLACAMALGRSRARATRRRHPT
jgi:hypothetical protein